MKSTKRRRTDWTAMRLFCPFLALTILCLSVAVSGFAQTQPKPGTRDKCPVCGMFVAKFPDWTAVLLFRDGAQAFFDGAKDMFKFHLDPKRYDPSRKAEDITGVRVIDYYSLKEIDGRKAFYVAGSDVYGPMGRELIPFRNRSDAEEFSHDHKGKRVLRFEEISQSVLKELD